LILSPTWKVDVRGGAAAATGLPLFLGPLLSILTGQSVTGGGGRPARRAATAGTGSGVAAELCAGAEVDVRGGAAAATSLPLLLGPLLSILTGQSVTGEAKRRRGEAAARRSGGEAKRRRGEAAAARAHGSGGGACAWEQRRAMQLRREAMQFCIPSLLSKHFASRVAPSVGGGSEYAQ